MCLHEGSKRGIMRHRIRRLTGSERALPAGRTPAVRSAGRGLAVPSRQVGVSASPGRLPLDRARIGQLQLQRGNAFVSRLLAQRQQAATAVAPAAAYAPAADMASYLALVRALERTFPEKNPREILAMLRQAYYGKPWSTSTAPQWSSVLPGAPNPGDPRARAGSGPGSLLDALRQSQVVAGTPAVDLGHVFTGIEALLNPTTSVTIPMSVVPDVVVNMPNTEFATWGGDIGSAAGQAAVDPFLGRATRSATDYLNDLASPSDLEGDIDAYGVVHGAGDRAGLLSMLNAAGTVAPGIPVSLILADYYAGSGRLAGAHTDRYRDFVTAIGGTISGKTITNRATLEPQIAARVASFARTWFWKEYKNARGAARTAAVYATFDTMVTALADAHARIMTRLFLTWLEGKL